MEQECAVVNCSNSFTTGNLCVGFPCDAGLREEWITAIGRKGWTPKPFHGICAVHFHSSDWYYLGEMKYLKPSAVPRKCGSVQAVSEISVNSFEKDVGLKSVPLEKMKKSKQGLRVRRSSKVPQRGVSVRTNRHREKVMLQTLKRNLSMERLELQVCQEVLQAELNALNEFLVWREMELEQLERNIVEECVAN